MKKSQAIKAFENSIPKLAEALKCTNQAIYQWGDLVPEKRALQLERLTNGQLKYHPKHYR